MERIILRVSASDPIFEPNPQVIFSLDYPPGLGGDARLDLHTFQSIIDAYVSGALPPDGVKQLGQQLYTALVQKPDISDAFSAAILAQRCPVYVYLRGLGLPELLPWEALCTNTDTFLALDQRWPIGRIMPTAMNVITNDISYRSPPRILAVLSCLDVSAVNQWNELWAAVQAAPAGATTQVKVLTSEPDLRAQIAGSGDPRVSVDLLSSQQQLETMVGDFRPHVLHFFCHGATQPRPKILLATTSDQAGGLPETVVLEPQQIRALCNTAEPPLLVVLNCCKGGQSEGGMLSLAGDLVYRYGFPAVIAMREQVLAESADTLTAALYPEVMAMFADLSAAGAERVVLDWSRLIVSPRIRLCESQQQPGGGFSIAAANTRDWTIPVLYMRQPASEVNVGSTAASPADQLTLQLLRGMLASAGPTAPASWLDTLKAQIARIEAVNAP